LAPRLNETRGELRPRENDVLLQSKKQIRVSLWKKHPRRAMDLFQSVLERSH
jgi:hypothetical protein